MKKNRSVTIKDVAEKANVSMMTVSRAYKEDGRISEATKQKVLQIAAELGYHPSRIARGLASNKTFQFGLIVPDIRNPFFSQIALAAQNIAWENGYSTLLINSMENQEHEISVLRSLEVDGIILCSSRQSQDQLETNLINLPPTILINREVDIDTAGTILINDEEGAIKAVNHLLALGRQRIAFLAGPTQSTSNFHRRQGYIKALEAKGIPLDENFQISSEATYQASEAACKTLLTKSPDIDAIFCYNDLVAVGAIQACQTLGRSIPEDIAIIGVDDIPLASIVNPKLSTLRNPTYEIGVSAAKLLLESIQNEKGGAKLFFSQSLILRDSTPS